MNGALAGKVRSRPILSWWGCSSVVLVAGTVVLVVAGTVVLVVAGTVVLVVAGTVVLVVGATMGVVAPSMVTGLGEVWKPTA